jgi:hypothetical protein
VTVPTPVREAREVSAQGGGRAPCPLRWLEDPVRIDLLAESFYKSSARSRRDLARVIASLLNERTFPSPLRQLRPRGSLLLEWIGRGVAL